eukprot:4174884-Amphidinium_carterae.2
MNAVSRVALVVELSPKPPVTNLSSRSHTLKRSWQELSPDCCNALCDCLLLPIGPLWSLTSICLHSSSWQLLTRFFNAADVKIGTLQPHPGLVDNLRQEILVKDTEGSLHITRMMVGKVLHPLWIGWHNGTGTRNTGHSQEQWHYAGYVTTSRRLYATSTASCTARVATQS